MYIVIAGGGKIGSYLAGIMLKSGNEGAGMHSMWRSSSKGSPRPIASPCS